MQRAGNVIVPLPEVDSEDRCSVDVFGGDTVFSSAPSAAFPWHITAMPYLDGYEGELIFPQEFITYFDKPTQKYYNVPCFDVRDTGIDCLKPAKVMCSYPQISNRYLDEFESCRGDLCDAETTAACKATACPSNLKNYQNQDRCVQPCFQPCPHYAYPDLEYRMMWIAYVVPGTTSIPLNFYIVGGFYFGGKKFHKDSRPPVKIAAVLALLWAIIAVLPSLFAYTDLVCEDHGYSVRKGDSVFCHFLRGSIHILQCMYYWVAIAIADLYFAVVKELPMRTRDSLLKKMGSLAFFVPFAMMIGTYILQERDPETLDSSTDTDGVKYPNRSWNNLKDVFTCTGLFNSLESDILLVYIHFVLAGICIIGFLARVVAKILSSSTRTTNTASNNGLLSKICSYIKLLGKSSAKKLIKLGCLSTLLLIFNLIVIAQAFPKFALFDEQMESLLSCQTTIKISFEGDQCLKDNSCCDYTDPTVLGTAPNSVVLALGYYFAIAAIPLVFGTLFCSDKKVRLCSISIFSWSAY
jgi:hypothetical protein